MKGESATKLEITVSEVKVIFKTIEKPDGSLK